MSIFLEGLKLAKYRGIGPDWQECNQFGSMNFFVGPNNSEKSDILNFIASHIGRFGSDNWYNVATNDQYNRGTLGATEVMIPEATEKIIASIPLVNNPNFGSQQQVLEKNRNTLRSLFTNIYGAGTSQVWHHLRSGGGKAVLSPDFTLRSQINQQLGTDVQLLWSSIAAQGSNNIDQWIAGIGQFVATTSRLRFPDCKLVPAMRQIGKKDERFTDYSGTGLIDKLLEVEAPDHDAQGDREKFDKINDFLQTVTGEPEARINIPYHRSHVMVHTKDRVLPLHYLGTGIHEVIMIAAFCTLSDDCIICLEEPEIHLHPILQRKLINYLIEKTNNQYFIATHSHCFIDTEGSRLFEVAYAEKQTRIKSVVQKADRYSVCQTLGYRASDLVQANAVVWVEGPTDRIYINHWISAVDQSLKEGIHYSIMFYGGRLLNHLTAADDEVSDFIELRNLNRNLAIVIDSDRADPSVEINATKTRIASEIRNGGYVWISAGREIENYIGPDQIVSALTDVYSNTFDRQAAAGEFSHSLYYYDKDGQLRQDADKIKVAKSIAKTPADLSVLDLRERIEELVAFIRTANL